MSTVLEEHKAVDNGEANWIQGLQDPFIQHGKDAAAACKDVESNTIVEKGSIGMVLFSTFVAVCGSFSFGTCLKLLFWWVGYSASTQAAIREDLNLSLAEVPVYIAEIAPKNLRGGLATTKQDQS
ncbi:hypothetical protein JHK85_046794 [Glycine max]|nr:hypothetical protein JHK85_046794 [Glycine max]